MGISLEGSLSGPTPWHIEGTAKVTLLFFELSVHVKETFGSVVVNTLPEVDAWAELKKVLLDQRSWSGSQPAGSVQVAVLEAPEPKDKVPLLMDPSSPLKLHQKLVPLSHPLTKFGEAKIKGQNEFTIESVKIGGAQTTFEPESDLFAPGQFEQLTDEEKVSGHSFEKMQAGVALGNQVTAFGTQYATDVVYQDIILDVDGISRRGKKFSMGRLDQLALSRSGAAAQSMLRDAQMGKYGPDPSAPKLMTLDDEQFVVAGVDDLQRRADISPPTTKTAADAALKRYLAKNPQDRGRLQVVPQVELEAA
jgi:hypothetical protein